MYERFLKYFETFSNFFMNVTLIFLKLHPFSKNPFENILSPISIYKENLFVKSHKFLN